MHLDREALAALGEDDSILFELPDGDFFPGVIRRRAARSPERFTLSGDSIRGPGDFVLAIRKGVLVGFLHEPGRGAHRVRLTPEGIQVIESTPLDRRLECGFEALAPTGGIEELVVGNGPSSVPNAGKFTLPEPPVVDVLVVYTLQAQLDAGGPAAMEAEIDAMMEWNRVVYENTRIRAVLKLVYSRAIGSNPLPTIQQLAGKNDGVLDEVHGLRDAYGADQVALVQEAQGGIALGLRNLDPDSESTAFCINGRESAPNVLSHELGHNLGCCHAIGQGGGCPLNRGLLFPFSTGHSFTGNTGTHFTVMAGGLTQYFSDPLVYFDGAPTGVFAGAGGHPGAENARTVEIAAPTVATWRENDGVCESLDLASDAPDCDGDLIPDACEIALGLSSDANMNGIPDECEPLPAGDLNADGSVDLADLSILRAHLGMASDARRQDGDLDRDGRVGLSDLEAFFDAVSRGARAYPREAPQGTKRK